jgi:prolyl-tRNA synthetase
MRKFLNSYKDLPLSVYQIQNKFRAELRSKGGLMRGREFMMKDLYSFHLTSDDLNNYYQQMIGAYKRVYQRCGLDVKVVEASGGVFTDNFSHEFQVVSEAGEDKIVYCDGCDWAQNSEIAKLNAGDKCPKCGSKIKEGKSIEVGNIFNFGEKYAKDMNGYINDEKGEKRPVLMASYGIGISRLVATIVEKYHDEKGIIWPKAVAPFQVHLLSIKKNETAQTVYDQLISAGIEVLFDDRDVSAGQKFADADLLGLTYRLVVSDKAGDKIEFKKRKSSEIELLGVEDVIKLLAK